MAAIFKRDGIYFIKFKDSHGVLRIMELSKGKEILTKEFEKRKKEALFFLEKSHSNYLYAEK
ncbi:MAG: hypothetical protein GXO21_06580 [Aquificae bacterium]|nr:hypothetical protein [Aquificota bacterium]